MGTTACAECARNCLVIHGKNKEPSPVVQSFFKIMIGDNFPKFLLLPPKISRTMPDLVSKETQLEDASGQRWAVKLSWQEESLAFHEGWPAFSRGHDLEVGDLLVFHYVLGSHFVVQIYGKTGCERLHFSTENGSRKKRRTKTPSGAEDGKDHSIGRNSMNKQGQDSSALSDSYIEKVADTMIIHNDSARKVLNEEQLCMIGMDARHRHEDHQNSLYDLPTFEMQRTSNVDANAGVLEHERSPCHGNRMLTSQAGEYIVDRIPVAEKVVASDVRNLEFPDANEDLQMTEKAVLVSKKDSGDGNTIGPEQSEKRKSRKCPEPKDSGNSSNHPAKKEDHISNAVKEPKDSGNSSNHPAKKEDHISKAVKEPKDSGNSSNHPAKKEDHISKVVKPEPVDTFDSPSADSGTTSLRVTETKAFLDLPRGLPSVKFKFCRAEPSSRRAVVLLRDPESRLWPVIYHERSIMKALTGGWEVFTTENSIQPGDECSFEVENKDESIYEVSIVRR